MADILHDFPIKAPPQDVFLAVATPAGLSAWWTLRASGQPEKAALYELYFGPRHDWRAAVSQCVPGREFELELTLADEDWLGTRVGFRLDGASAAAGITQVRFHHLGWPRVNDHYRTSCFCWAMYLRLLRRYVEEGEIVPYDRRLDA
jgi:uncharacterized protein YndB with AHSA1/START domain